SPRHPDRLRRQEAAPHAGLTLAQSARQPKDHGGQEMTRRRRWLLVISACACAGLGVAAAGARRPAEEPDDQARVRCATRVSLALTGRSASEELLAAADPQSMARALMATPEFADYFARFVNASFNPEPGMSPAEDASYYLARKIIEEGRPWAELFNGPYRVRP